MTTRYSIWYTVILSITFLLYCAYTLVFTSRRAVFQRRVNRLDSNAKSIDQQVVYFGGDVRRTGPIPYNRNLTLYQALQAAGGQNEFGSIKRVAVFRNGRRTVYDLTNPQHMDVLLQPNDTIDVPRKNILGQ